MNIEVQRRAHDEHHTLHQRGAGREGEGVDIVVNQHAHDEDHILSTLNPSIYALTMNPGLMRLPESVV